MHAHKFLYILSDSEDSEDENPENASNPEEHSIVDQFPGNSSLLSNDNEDYNHLRIVYKGIFSTLELVKHKHSDQDYVIKWIPRASAPWGNLDNQHHVPVTISEEYRILQHLNHQNVIDFFGTVDSCQPELFGIVLEYFPNGALFDLDPRITFDFDQSLDLTNDLLNGVHYLHQSGIIHRDINPSNLLLTRTNRLKIADFGVSVCCNGENDILLTGTIGTSAYLAPECVSEPGTPYYGKPVDVWASGLSIYWIWTKEVYFNRPDKYQTYQAIRVGVVNIDARLIPTKVVQLLNRMLQKDPLDRSPISDVLHE